MMLLCELYRAALSVIRIFFDKLLVLAARFFPQTCTINFLNDCIMKFRIKIVMLAVFIACFGTSKGGGFIVVNPSGSNTGITVQNYMLDVRSLKVETNINDITAFTTVDQVFYNSSSQRLEGWFLFPVPENAVLSNFKMEINGKMTEAELLDAEKARKIYEDIVRRVKDPALLEYSDRALYKVRIFPIEPQSEKKIHIEYREILKPDNHTLHWVFPLNTEKYSAKPIENISMRVNISSDKQIGAVFSPSHNAELVRTDANHAVVGYEKKTVKSDKDFKLYINYTQKDIGLSLLSYEEPEDKSGKAFFLLNLSPVFYKKNEPVISKDISFVLDVSGSMDGEKIQQAKSALNYCIDGLNKGDRFEIVKFSTVGESLFGELRTASAENRKSAKVFIDRLKAIGGTNMEEAFDLAFKTKTDPSRPHIMVFITDGKPTIGTTEPKALLKKINDLNSGKTRIFTFGIGDDINTHLLDKITLDTKAHRTYIGEGEDINLSIASFFNKVSSPVLTDIRIEAQGITLSEIYPRNLPDLFSGTSLSITGRYDKSSKAKIKLIGKLNGKEKVFTWDVNFAPSDENDFVPVFWAGRKIAFLLDQIRLNGENKELTDEVKRLALKYGIITPYTSYLILEDEQMQITDGDLTEEETIFIRRFAGDSEADKFVQQSKREYSEMNSASGAGSVQKSKEIQSQTAVDNMEDILPGSERMVYRGNSGNQNFAQQYKPVAGRAVYQSRERWVDIYAQQSDYPEKRLAFAGKAYFDLLNKHPEVGKFYALGQNVQFVFKNTLYIIEQ